MTSIPGQATRDCVDPWTYLEVRVSGGIAPCCVRPEIASLHHQTLSEALNSPAMRRLRANLLQGTLDKRCAGCKQRAETTPAALRQKVRALLASVPAPPHADIAAFRQAEPHASPAAMDAFSHALLAARVPGAPTAAAAPAVLPVPFHGLAYLEANPDLADQALAPLDYVLRHGAAQRRRLRLRESALPESDGGPALPFNPELYLRLNPDVARAGANPIAHYLKHGRYEFRRLQ
jgi:hypothetical protein